MKVGARKKGKFPTASTTAIVELLLLRHRQNMEERQRLAFGYSVSIKSY